MGVSFKVSKTGTRFRPKPVAQLENDGSEVSEDSKGSSLIGSKNESSTRKLEGDIAEGLDDLSGASSSFISDEVSFLLNLYPDGYSIGKPLEQADASKLLHPYDRTSETLFSAIESGRLPGDILDDIPCTYINGSLICEVRDYRKCAPDQGSSVPTANPVVNKVCLRMSLENVVKDIPLISDNSWTYGDLMEVESRILKALQPQLCLDPTPKLDRLSKDPVPVKLNLALSSLRRKRLRQLAEVTVTSNNRIHGKKVCIDRVPESSNSRFEDSGMISGNVMPQHVPDMTAQNIGPNNLVALRARNFVPDGNVQAALPLISPQSRYQMGVGTPRSIMDQGSGSLVNIQGASPAGQDMMISYGDNANSVASFHGKRENQDAQMSPLSSFNKRMRLGQLGSDGIQQQQIGPHMDNLHPTDINWKNSILQKPAMARAILNAGIQKYPQQMFEGVMNQNAGATSLSTGQSGMRFGPKEEQFENEKLDSAELSQGKNDMHMMQTETSQLELYQSRPLQQRLPQHLMRHNLPQEAWNNIGQDSRKEEQLQKRKSVQSPRLSTGALVQSPLSSKSGEFSSGSAGPHFGAVAATAAVGSSQKEKSAVTSGPAVGGNPSLTYSTNDSLQRQHQAQLAAKRRTNSLPKTTAMSGVASPASVSNISVPLNANSPSVGTPPMADHSMLERFSKIEMVTMRHQLNCKKNKVDNYPVRKPYAYSPQQLMTNLANNEDFKDDTSRELSKSLIGGSMNTCKMRTINFMLADRVLQGNVVSYVPRARGKMIMSQKPSDGTVAMQYVDVEDVDVLSAEDYLPTLPNSHFADLLAKQFFSLMARDGYLMEDHIQPKPPRSTVASSSQPNAIGIPPNNSQVEVQQYNEVVPSQPSNEIKPTISGNASVNSSLNLLANSRMMPPGNPQSLQMSQGLLSGVSLPARPQQLDPQGPQPSLQQQQPQPQQQAQQQPQQQPPSQQQEQNQQMMMQQQHSPFQRSPMGLSSNPLSQLNAMGQNSNMQLGNHMVNKPSALQRQLLQQQQQQQIQPQQQQQLQPQQRQQLQLEQRKMMMALGTTMGVANIGNGMVGLGNLGNTMGIGGARGIGGLGISGPMTPMSGMSSVGQNQMNLGQTSNFTNTTSQQLRNVQMTPQQAAFLTSKIKMMQQSRTNMLGGSAARQMHPSAAGLSMLCQSINRTNMNPIQRSLGPMGPPKLMQANLYLNPQQQQQQQPQQQMQLQQQQQQQQQLQQLQQQQQQQQLQQLQQQQQPPQMQQQQQQETSLQQAVMSPSQVGSPSTMGILQLNQQSQQQPSPQQMSQRTPMSPQMSSGAIHAISAGNPEACPASPQLSSQTLGSVGSITNSPMELQGVNKSNSVGNA